MIQFSKLISLEQIHYYSRLMFLLYFIVGLFTTNSLAKDNY